MRSRTSIRNAVSNTFVIGKSDAESEPLIRMYRSGITPLNVQPDGSDTVRQKGIDDGRRVRKLRARQLHTVARVTGEANRHGLNFFQVLLELSDRRIYNSAHLV